MESDQYITTGIQSMAITWKQKEPSTGTYESDDDHYEDYGPSKKTATTFQNVKSPESILLPRSGSVPVVTMVVHLGEREEVARILLDTGSTVPLLSRSYVPKKRVTVDE